MCLNDCLAGLPSEPATGSSSVLGDELLNSSTAQSCLTKTASKILNKNSMNKMLKKWTKRIYHIPGIAAFELRRKRLSLKGASLAPGCALSPMSLHGNYRNLIVKKGAFIGRVSMMLHDTVEINDYAILNDGVTILTASHDINSPFFSQVSSPITIGKYAWVCTNALLLPGVSIGEGAVVGAGAVISKSVDPYTVVVGNPARVLRRERNRELNYDPVAFLAPFEAWK